MFWSKSFIYTLKNTPLDAESKSHQLMLRASMIRMLGAGVYSYLPLGYRVLNNISKIVSGEMDACGAQQLLLPALQPLDLWQVTGRDKLLGEIMLRFKDRKGRSLCLGPTHEEVITELASRYIQSYRDLPITLYQIQTKFRDELRPRFGLVRCCEFIMKDAYSFDRDDNGLNSTYDKMHRAYENIFTRCGLYFLSVKADSGVIGGDLSHEFLIPADNGEDVVYKCSKCGCVQKSEEKELLFCSSCKAELQKINALEIGHIFKLGIKYSDAFDLKYLDETGQKKPVIMGCYGIGVSRLLAAIIEQNSDTDGIIWPGEVSPFKIIIVPVNTENNDIFNVSSKIHDLIEKKGISVLLDDRNQRAGIKFKDADLIGVPYRVTIGDGFLKEGKLEIKSRKTKEVKVFRLEELDKIIEEILNKK